MNDIIELSLNLKGLSENKNCIGLSGSIISFKKLAKIASVTTDLLLS